VFTHARQNPDALAICNPDSEMTYAELWQAVVNAAAELSARRVNPGDRVVLEAASEPEFLILYLACHALSAVAVPISRELLEKPLPDELEPTLVLRWEDMLNFTGEGGECIIESWASLDDVADILFTTGTVGKPKGVMLSHRNISASARNINETIAITSDDREVVPLPLSHSFGLGRVRCCLTAGAAIALVPGFRSPGAVIQMINAVDATGFATVPAGMAILLRLFGDKLSGLVGSLKYVELGSSPMPRDHKMQMLDSFPDARLFMHYGLTEASRSAFIEFHTDTAQLESAGRATPNVEIWIVDDAGAPVGVNELGRIAIRGEHVSLRYLGEESKENRDVATDCLITEDIGRLDDNGYLHIVGRADEMINTGGLKFAPDEIEFELRKIDEISDAACVSVSDPKQVTGEMIWAFLVPSGSQRPVDSEISGSLARVLPHYKVPAVLEWVKKLPRTASGKLQRSQLRSLALSKRYKTK
jgi:long-chain acyl-CoA synthetase